MSAKLLVTKQPLPASGYGVLQSWRCLRLATPMHLLIWRSHLLIRRSHLLIRRTHLLIRRSHLLIWRTHLLIWRTHLLFRRTHLLIRRVHNAPYWRVITQMLQKNCRLG